MAGKNNSKKSLHKNNGVWRHLYSVYISQVVFFFPFFLLFSFFLFLVILIFFFFNSSCSSFSCYRSEVSRFVVNSLFLSTKKASLLLFRRRDRRWCLKVVIAAINARVLVTIAISTVASSVTIRRLTKRIVFRSRGW